MCAFQLLSLAAIVLMVSFGQSLASQAFITYDGSFVTIGPWIAPEPDIRPEAYYWGSYLVSANTSLRGLNRTTASPDSGVATRGDLDCADVIGQNFQVDVGNDPNGFDADHDGIGCESR